MVETTHAFVKLKQIKAAVSAGGIKFVIGCHVAHMKAILQEGGGVE